MNKFKQYINLESIIATTILGTLIIYGIYHNSAIAPTVNRILIVVTIVGTLPLCLEIIKSVIKKDFGVDLIALIAIISTLLVGEYIASAIILLMLSGGESLERYAENKAKRSLEKLLHYAPTTAHIFENDLIRDIPIEEVTIGQKILVKPNEVVPIDGTIVSGVTTVDESTITGEPIPKEVSPGSKLWSGSLNLMNVIIIEATTTHEQSTLQAIIRLVEEAENNKAPMVRLADRYSVVFTIITLTIAGIAAYFDTRLGAAVLVVATPCPLILAAPIAFIAGMSRSARKGIIVKHGGVFEAMTDARVYLFDKTGTVTLGIPMLETIVPHGEYDPNQLLRTAASIEQFSTHILGKSITQEAQSKNLPPLKVTDQKEILGKGVTGCIDSSTYTIGKAKFLESLGITVTKDIRDEVEREHNQGNMLIHIAKDSNIIGSFVFIDSIRDNSLDALTTIKEYNIQTVLLTGDTKNRAESIGQSLGFKTIHSECLPQDKVNIIKEYETKKIKTVMIGDGVNDAPALGAATVGIALGHSGQTASTDTADAIILRDDISKISELLSISYRTMFIAKQSVFAGMGLSIVAMVCAAFGYLPPIYGALLQEGVDVLVILNALRALKD